jgi:hypothetical protein
VSLRPIAPSQGQVTPTEFEPSNVLVSIDRQLLRSSALDRQEEPIASSARASRRTRIYIDRQLLRSSALDRKEEPIAPPGRASRCARIS